jgi:hypothetical protein
VNLLANLWTVLLREIKIAERAMEIHSRPEHVGIDDKDLLALRTTYFYSLTHQFTSPVYFSFGLSAITFG